MPKQVDPAQQRQEIRAAARRTFARRGVRGTGLEHVARAAGMGRSSLYHYYRDKDALLKDLVGEALEAERALFHHCLRADGPVLDRVRKLLASSVQLFESWSSLGRMLFDFRLSDSSRFRRFFREVRGEFAEVLRQGQRSGELSGAFDPELAASTLIGVIDGLLFQYFSDARAFPDLDALNAELARTAERVLAA